MSPTFRSISEDTKLAEGLFIVIYGPPFSGKTTFAVTAPNPVLLDTEHSRRTLKGTEYEKVPYVDIFSIADLKTKASIIPKELPDSKSVIVDTISYLADKSYREDAIKHNRSEQVPSQFEYNAINIGIKNALEPLRKEGRHIILTMHEKEIKNNDGTTVKITPNIGPSLASWIASQADVVGYLSAEYPQGQYRGTLQLLPRGLVQSKNRLRMKPTYTNPTFDIFLEGLNNNE